MTPVTPIKGLIPERQIVVVSPHYDDVLFTVGGYAAAASGGFAGRRPHEWSVEIVFSRSNYQCRAGVGNADVSLGRVKETTGKRLLEDTYCLDELLGRHAYRYELHGEDECLLRGKHIGAGGMEFPHGTYADYAAMDYAIEARLISRIRRLAECRDTALVFPLAIREHVDHFIVRQAAAAVMEERVWPATFYFAEDKPYAGLADEVEWGRTQAFIDKHRLVPSTYAVDHEYVIELAFRHYVSQVEPVYAEGIRRRVGALQAEVGVTKRGFDRIYRYAGHGG